MARLTQKAQDFFEAVRSNNLEGVSAVDRTTLNEFLGMRDPRDLEQTVLHVAAGLGYIDMSLYLIRAGSSIEKTDELGLTPLETAVLNDRKDLVCTLLTAPEFEEDFKQLRTSNGSTVLHLVSELILVENTVV